MISLLASLSSTSKSQVIGILNPFVVNLLCVYVHAYTLSPI